jgi:hypothetical protein
MEREVSALRAGLALLLLAAAVVAALLAHEIRDTRHALAQGDALYAVAPQRATWPDGTLLGVDDDVALRRALQLYVRFAATPNRLDTAPDRAALRAQAETALTRVARGAHASQAETLLGILAFDRSADDAIGDFTDAVRSDPANVAAKFDLELLLRLAAAHGSRTGAGPGGSFGKGGRRGAGGGVAGSGY